MQKFVEAPKHSDQKPRCGYMRAHVPIPEDPSASRMQIWAFVLLKFLLPKPKATHIGHVGLNCKRKKASKGWVPFPSNQPQGYYQERIKQDIQTAQALERPKCMRIPSHPRTRSLTVNRVDLECHVEHVMLTRYWTGLVA